MREIKFRGKDIENDNPWRYGSLITYPSGCTSIIGFDELGNELNHDVDPDTVLWNSWASPSCAIIPRAR